MSPKGPRIVIRQLPMTARIGVHDWEKVEPQPVVLDLEFDLGACKACSTDRLADTVDYAAVVDRVREIAMRPHDLVEAMASSICTDVLRIPTVQRVQLTLLTLAPFPGAQVGVTLSRDRERRYEHDHQHF